MSQSGGCLSRVEELEYDRECMLTGTASGGAEEPEYELRLRASTLSGTASDPVEVVAGGSGVLLRRFPLGDGDRDEEPHLNELSKRPVKLVVGGDSAPCWDFCCPEDCSGSARFWSPEAGGALDLPDRPQRDPFFLLLMSLSWNGIAVIKLCQRWFGALIICRELPQLAGGVQ